MFKYVKALRKPRMCNSMHFVQQSWECCILVCPESEATTKKNRCVSFLTTVVTVNNHQRSESEVAQPCPTLCDPMGCSLPGSSVHGIFQARVLEWVAISFSRGSSQPRDRTRVSHTVADALPSEPLLFLTTVVTMNNHQRREGAKSENVLLQF